MVTRTPHTPVPVEALPEFTPVPRKRPRHDGWTPERQRAFVAALADTGCVSIACRMVNMSQPSYYHLRRQPGAESFRAAADAAHTLGLQVVKDEAFDRAMHGQLVPVFVGGKLMGFRRKKNDRLLMFILRHYWTDAAGRRTTINYFSTRATAGAAANPPQDGEGDHAEHGGGGPETRTTALAAAESSTTTVKTVISGSPVPSPQSRDTDAAALLNAFEGVALDAEAHEEIARALEACAERRRMLDPDYETPRPERLRLHAQDEQCDFIRSPPGAIEFVGELERDGGCEEFVPFAEGEPPWEQIGAPKPQWYLDWEAEQEAKAALPAPEPQDPPRDGEGERACEQAPGEPVTAQPEHGGGGPSSAPEAEDGSPEPSPESLIPSPQAEDRQAKARRRDSAAGPERETVPAGQPAPEATGLTSRSMVRDGLPAGSATAHPEQGPSEVEGRVEGPTHSSPESPTPSPQASKVRKPYKPRTPKPPFTPPDVEAEARARDEVAAERREAAEAEARRRKKRKAN